MPHHTVSVAGLLGGGSPPRPGEVSLAHRGVLYLDALPEFSRAALEGLREPLANKSVTVVRARSTTTYPADFVLVASATFCPCGWTGHPERPCTDSPAAVERWQARIPWGLFDMVVRVNSPEESDQQSASSAVVASRIARVRELQATRERELGHVDDVPAGVKFSGRCLAVARTIADLDGDELLAMKHIDEALALQGWS